MSMDLSSHYLPDVSDISVAGEFSNASFQIPSNRGETPNLLLADDSFFHGMNDTLVTPAATHQLRRPQPPLTLDELTPRSRRIRTAPVRSFLRAIPNIPSPLKTQVTRDLSIALEEALSPLKPQETSFFLPSSSMDENLMATEDSRVLRQSNGDLTFTDEPEVHAGSRESLTLSQLTPGPGRIQRSPPATLSVPVSHSNAITTEEVPLEDVCPSGDSDVLESDLPEQTADPVSEADSALAQSISTANIPLHHSVISPLIVPDASGSSGIGSSNHITQSNTVPPGMIATLPSKELPPTVKGNARTKSSKAQTKPKRTVIGGGINKRLKPKLPNAAQDIPKAGRQPLTNPTAVHGSGAVGHNATEKRVHDPSHINPRSGTQIYTGPNKNSVPGGLAAALMSFSQRTTTVTSDRATVSKEQTGSVTVPSPAPASDVGRKDLETESAQPPRESLPADGDYQQRSIPGTALSPAPDGASDLFSRLEQPLCEIPLTSPQDEDIRDPTVPAVPLSLSPMRPSVKRRSSPGPGDEQPRKKGKDDSDTNDVFTVEPRQVRVHVQASSKPTVSLRSKTLQPSRPKPANVPASRSVTATHSNAAQGLPKVQGSTNTASTSTWGHPTKATADARLNARPRHLTASGSTRSIHDQNLVGGASCRSLAASSSRSGDALGEGLLAGNTLEPRRLPQLAPGSGAPAVLRTRPAAGRKPLIEKPIHPAPKQEKPPFEFTFSMEKRPEGGKAEENRATKGLDEYKRALKADGLLPIPDYKRMHSAQEAALTARRGQIVPVVPLPLELHTDVRAHEREQFEDGLRERRREAERVAEEKRRVREVEEEREVRELRRRAVPKAHEVPEWYAHAPKRAARLDESEDVGV